MYTIIRLVKEHWPGCPTPALDDVFARKGAAAQRSDIEEYWATHKYPVGQENIQATHKKALDQEM